MMLHLIAGSLAAGAVGAGITHLGCAVFAVDLRRPPWRIALTCAVGAVSGMLFYLGERKILDERLLFFLWQPAVAFAIGLGLPRQKARAPEGALLPLDVDLDRLARSGRTTYRSPLRGA